MLLQSIDNQHKAYWLGFLTADGSVIEYSPFYWRITIGLSSRDDEHAQAFANFVNKPVYHNAIFDKRTGKTYHRSTVHYYADAEYLKSIDYKNLIPDMPEHLIHHYIRGYFDGDGSVGIYNGSIRWKLVNGDPRIIEQIADILRPIVKAKLSILRYENVWHISAGGRHIAKRFFDYLYQDAEMYLKRKEMIFRKGGM